MFINTSSNRQIVEGVAKENDLDLIEPEVFILFLSGDSYISSWDDVKNEMMRRGYGYIDMSSLKRQYLWCAGILKSRGYTEIDTSRL